jgi:putative hemolysin
MRGMNTSLPQSAAPGFAAHAFAAQPHRGVPPAAVPAAAPRLEAVWAQHADDVQAAQRLRWRVFTQEMGARLTPPPGTPFGVDADPFDAHCEHLLVRTQPTDDGAPEVVGTYRVLTPAGAQRLGGLYSDTEFDLLRLARLRPHIAELGRSCTAPGWRQGGVMLMLWASLGSFMQRNSIERVVGCASIPMFDGGQLAADLWHSLKRNHLAPADEQVYPRLPLPVDRLRTGADVEVPALIKGYLRCGGKVLGPPAWDPHFGVADLPMMLRLADLPQSHKRRFISN